MKTILCFGDSNTHGYNPHNGGRYAYADRWPGALQLLLGRDDYYVVEEGLNSRTTVHRDPVYDDNKSGLAVLPVLIKSHMPIDLCILMLGTNDMKHRFAVEACDIGRAATLLVKTARNVSAEKSPTGSPCEVLLVSPPPVTTDMLTGRCADEFGERALAISQALPSYLEEAARNTHAHFLDAAQFVCPDRYDGLHLTPEGHHRLAEAMAEQVRRFLQ